MTPAHATMTVVPSLQHKERLLDEWVEPWKSQNAHCRRVVQRTTMRTEHNQAILLHIRKIVWYCCSQVIEDGELASMW